MESKGVAAKVELKAAVKPEWGRIFTPEALNFLAELQGRFEAGREQVLRARVERQARLDQGEPPGFLPETRAIREGEWTVASVPPDLERRLVEITGPVDRKMMINALNSGADVFMADFEDALSPAWENIAQGQVNLWDAARRTISFEAEDGKTYRLSDRVATLLVRPRGWHLVEKHLLVDGKPIAGALMDAGLYVFHNRSALRSLGSGPYFYLPKLESHREARLWSEVFKFIEDRLRLVRGTIKATVLIETVLAAFEMEEILYELKEHIVGLNAGRWDYIFSIIKKFQRQSFCLPDRGQITMTVPFMHAYSELVVRNSHRRGAHALGGMAAYIPNRRDAERNERALTGVRLDKEREVSEGFDGTWVAHPDLVATARAPFAKRLGDRPHQKERRREDLKVEAAQLVDFKVPGGAVTEAGVRNNVSVCLQYMSAWLAGRGAVGVFDLMEDAATAEISRSQLWQWLKEKPRLADGRTVDRRLFDSVLAEEAAKLGDPNAGTLGQAVRLLSELVEGEFAPFFTLRAYDLLP